MKIGCVYCDAKGQICTNEVSDDGLLCQEHGGKLTLEEQVLFQQAVSLFRAATGSIRETDEVKANYLLGRTLDRLILSISQRANMAAMRERSDSLKRRAP